MGIASGFKGVFEIGPVFRAEKSYTTRHGTEFTGYDVELSYIQDLDLVIEFQKQMILALFKSIKNNYYQAIKEHYSLSLNIPKYFHKMTIEEAKIILKDLKIPSKDLGDLSPQEEKEIGKYIKEKFDTDFVFITKYPAESRTWYHKRFIAGSKSYSDSYDLLYKGLEITTGALREESFSILSKQALEKGINLDSVKYYLDFFKYGCPPHGGFGPSRFLMSLLNIENIRETSYIYRGVKRLTP